MPEPIVPPEEQPTDIPEPGIISGLERNDYTDQKLREFGIEIDESTETPEKKAEGDESELSEAEKTILEEKKKQEATQAEMDAQRAQDAEKVKAELEQKAREDEEKKKAEESLKVEKPQDEFPWVKEGRDPTEKEVLDYTANQAANIVRQEQADKEAEQRKQQETAEQQKTEYRQAWEKEWARQIDALEEAGHLPKVVDTNNKQDPGLVERARLWEEAVKNNMMNLTEVYLLKILPTKGKQPVGDNAPILRGDSANTTPDEDSGEFFYDEIHGKDVEQEATHMKI